MFAWGRAGRHACIAAGACLGKQIPAAVPHYPSAVRAVTTSLRDAAGGWPAALWLGLAAAVAIGGAGGASSGGIALAAAACLGACALAGVAAAGGVAAVVCRRRAG